MMNSPLEAQESRGDLQRLSNPPPAVAKSHKVLLVEDNALDAHLIEIVLSQHDPHPAGEFDFRWVQSLSEAFKWLEQHPVDVVLLDLNLPDSVGLQSLSSLRSVVRDTPIVVLTGQHDPALGTQAIRNGAQDYLCKHEATGEHLNRSLHFALERFQRQRVEFELAGAGFIQRTILSRQLPSIAGLQLAARCEPAEAVAGDFYDFIRLDDASLVMVLGDASGKGLGPALLMAETRGMIRSVLEWEHDPGDVLTKVNALVADDCVRGAFVTLFLAVLSPENRTVTYATAGHEGYLLGSSGQPKARLASQDPPLGIQHNHRYHSGRLEPLNETDLVLACTDGVTEGYRAASNQFFGTSRLFETIRRCAIRSADAILDEVFSAVKEFRDFGQDDMTAVVAKATA